MDQDHLLVNAVGPAIGSEEAKTQARDGLMAGCLDWVSNRRSYPVAHVRFGTTENGRATSTRLAN